MTLDCNNHFFSQIVSFNLIIVHAPLSLPSKAWKECNKAVDSRKKVLWFKCKTRITLVHNSTGLQSYLRFESSKWLQKLHKRNLTCRTAIKNGQTKCIKEEDTFSRYGHLFHTALVSTEREDKNYKRIDALFQFFPEVKRIFLCTNRWLCCKIKMSGLKKWGLEYTS